jgi:hypothetical protein
MSCQKHKITITIKKFKYIAHDLHCADGLDAVQDALREWLKELGVKIINKKEGK